ncbi:rod shape-determining protein MreC [Persicobacter psychrovividus]|uniref:Cell shape-determining protein MreC n=1 Tax=Persicobacter psychrovividus TaxID=387638 RepID=A0ABN6L5Q0_9BACT|nr:cell shape-determining protein MreC [Persicobacter psychrovividus]
MRELFFFIYRFRGLVLFLILELICGWLIVSNNSYQSIAFFHTSNRAIGTVYENKKEVSDYFNLKVVNEQLAAENAHLRSALMMAEATNYFWSNEFSADSVRLNQYKFTPVQVINNSIDVYHNYITIDKGAMDGLKPNMGVIGPNGVVGKVKSVSQHYATVVSMLNNKFLVSAKLQPANALCSVNWPGEDYEMADLNYVPRHVRLSVGDTVRTSGFDGIFPKNTMIGTVASFEVPEQAVFYRIRLKLATDFSSLSYLYVVENKLKEEQNALEQESKKQ